MGGRCLTKEKAVCRTRRRTFAQASRGSKIHLLSYPLVKHLGLPRAAQLILAVARHESLAVPRQEPGSTTHGGSGRDRDGEPVRVRPPRWQEDSMKRRRHTPRADHPQAPEGRPAAGRGPPGPRGGQAAGDQRGDLSLLAGPVRRPEDRRRPPTQGAGGENARLKRIVADKELQIQALKELGRGNW
jgi:hypothetical protein